MDEEHRPDEITDVFEMLREQPDRDVDLEGGWRRLQARIQTEEATAAEPVSSAWRRWGPGRWSQPWQLAGAAAAIGMVAALTVFTVGPGGASGGSEGRVTESLVEQPLVVVPEASEPASERVEGALIGYRLDLRLVRVGPESSMPRTAGAGDADPLRDILSTLRAALPDQGFELVDSWKGEVAGGAQRAAMESGHAFVFETVRDPDSGQVRLRQVRTEGAAGALVADELALEPGRVYVIGVPGPDGERLLAVRLERATGPIDEALERR